LASIGLLTLFIINAYGAMLKKTCANIPNAHPAIVVFINFVILGAAAFGLTELVRKTKLKVLIGE